MVQEPPETAVGADLRAEEPGRGEDQQRLALGVRPLIDPPNHLSVPGYPHGPRGIAGGGTGGVDRAEVPVPLRRGRISGRFP